ncbi:MAG: type II secretion system F family protein [Candidatus Paceibacterota bacterium]|jgi:type IV pilus assembly protein PilC
MIKFSYKLVTENNKIVSGTIMSFSKTLAKRKLSRDGSSVIMIMIDADSLFGKELSVSFLGRFKAIERILFFRNLAMMMDAGLPIAEALEILRDQVRNPRVKEAISAMIGEILNGQVLSHAMRPYPRYFPLFIVEMIRVGELSGNLVSTLDRISDNLEKDYEIHRKVAGAIAYPLVVLAVMIAIGAILMVYVLPKVSEMFKEVGATLPWLTSALLGASVFMSRHPFAILGAIALMVVAIACLYRTQKGRYAFHYVFLRIPIFGELVKESNLSQFFRSMDTLIASGISVNQSVEVSQKTLNNEVYKKALSQVHPVVLYGVPLTEALKPFPFLFPEQTRRVLAVGEQTGKFGESFRRVVIHYDRALSHKAKMITSLVEPILMVIAGVMVGALALSIFLPLYQMASVI